MNDVENVTKELSEAAFLHTDLIAVGHDVGRNFRMAGLGSVTLISYKNKQYAITCEHVVHNCSLFFQERVKEIHHLLMKKIFYGVKI